MQNEDQTEFVNSKQMLQVTYFVFATNQPNEIDKTYSSQTEPEVHESRSQSIVYSRQSILQFVVQNAIECHHIYMGKIKNGRTFLWIL